MNKPSASNNRTGDQVKEPLKKGLERLRKGPLTCPFCREEFNGLSELFAHIKDHCR